MHSDILIEMREKGMKHCMHKVNINTLETYISKEIFLKEQKVHGQFQSQYYLQYTFPNIHSYRLDFNISKVMQTTQQMFFLLRHQVGEEGPSQAVCCDEKTLVKQTLLAR